MSSGYFLIDCSETPIFKHKLISSMDDFMKFISVILSLTFGFVNASLADDREDAIKLLKLSLECVEPGTTQQAVSINKLQIDYPGFVLKTETTEFIRNPSVGPNSDAWEIAGSEQITYKHVAFHFYTIGKAVRTADGLSLECKAGRQCISELFDYEPGCDTTVSGAKICGNAGVSKQPRSTAFSKVTILNICKSAIDDAGLAIAMLAAVPDQIPIDGNTHKVTSRDTLNVRREPGTKFMIVGAIPPESGPIKATECRTVPGFKSPWCKVFWGEWGWASKQFLSQYTEQDVVR